MRQRSGFSPSVATIDSPPVGLVDVDGIVSTGLNRDLLRPSVCRPNMWLLHTYGRQVGSIHRLGAIACQGMLTDKCWCIGMMVDGGGGWRDNMVLHVI